MPGWQRFLATSGPSNPNFTNPRHTPPAQLDKELPLPPRPTYANSPGIPPHGSPGSSGKPSFTPPQEFPGSSSPSRSRQHSRSVSDKIPSFFGGQKKAVTPPAEMESRSVPMGGDYFYSEANTIMSKDASKSKPVDERNMDSGHCATCDSRVRWPKGLSEYRCSTCLMINDLKPVQSRTPQKESVVGEQPSRAGTYPGAGAAAAGRAPPLTLERSKALIDRCIDTYLDSCRIPSSGGGTLAQTPPASPHKSSSDNHVSKIEPSPRPAAVSSTPPDEPFLSPRLKSTGLEATWEGKPPQSTVSVAHKAQGISPKNASAPPSIARKPVAAELDSLPVRPARKPVPPPISLSPNGEQSHGHSARQMDSPMNQQSQRGVSPNPVSRARRLTSQSIFRPLEDYIMRSFGDRECLNTAFLRSRPSTQRSNRSEENVRRDRERSPPKRPPPFDTDYPDIDPKMLLLGNVAENGFWWTAKDQRSKSVGRRQKPDRPTEPARGLVYSKSPQISWIEVDSWYHLVLNAGKRWRERLKDTDLQSSSGLGSGVTLNDIDQAMTDATSHVLRTILKASENLLKRPGKPLREPNDIRFLLIMLANPSLYPSASTDSSPLLKLPQFADTLRPSETSVGSDASPSHRPRSHSQTGGGAWEQGNSFGIIKRVLGLLSNLPMECHRNLTAWFSRYDEERFRALVDVFERFVTHRLKRQHGRKKSNHGNPTDGLIPNLSGTSADTSAQLHAALGLGGAAKPSGENKNQHASYTEDWQIRAAARILMILFAANKNFHGERGAKSLAADAQMARPGSLSRTHIKNHGQLLSTSDFYNTMVDFLGLIADFDIWESNQGRFSFCQYPFFLSVGAKIRIMEHDAKRQMETRAREAFFDNILRNKNLEQFLVLRVRRECLVEDSLTGISEVVGACPEDIKKGLRVQFVGEEGIDAGGLRKEWFLSLVREIFDPHHALFLYEEESRLCYFNPHSFETSDQFFLVGALLGLAIYNSTILDVALPPFTFKKLLMSNTSTLKAPGIRPQPQGHTLEDLAEWRPSLARGLRQLLDFNGDVQETFCRDFVVEIDRYGEKQQVPLCSNGASRPVTNSNRHEFVDLYIRYLLDVQVARQFEPFKRGFFTVCGGNALSLFQPEEIELLVRGSDEPLDVPALKAVAVYENWPSTAIAKPGPLQSRLQKREVPITAPAEQIPLLSWFWFSFENATAQDQRRLLSFITGSDRIPAVGAANLVIKVGFAGPDRKRFPIARTCFNQLLLYQYGSRQELSAKLWGAVEGSEGFGLK